ncbi:MAG: hypothetical protein WCT31_04410 [Candidatus Micrarchaeia archaeon]
MAEDIETLFGTFKTKKTTAQINKEIDEGWLEKDCLKNKFKKKE